MDADRLNELLARIEKAEGPDRELDLALATALVPDVLVVRMTADNNGVEPYTYWRYTGAIERGEHMEAAHEAR